MRNINIRIILLIIPAIFISTAFAQSPQFKCRYSKIIAAGIYSKCRLKDNKDGSLKSCKNVFKQRWSRISKKAGSACLDASLKYRFYEKIISDQTDKISLQLGRKAKNLNRPERRCRNLKSIASGAYSICRYKGEAFLVRSKDLNAYSERILQCTEKFENSWENIIDKTEREQAVCFDKDSTFSEYKVLIDDLVTRVVDHTGNITATPTPQATSVSTSTQTPVPTGLPENTPASPTSTPTASPSFTVTQTATPANAVISLAGSPLQLETNGATDTLTITNTSTTVTANNITASFTGTALDGLVTETGNTCAVLAPNASCVLTFTPGNTVVAQTNFNIQGSNTNSLTAAIEVISSVNITAVNITSGAAAGGTGITITGSNLTGATSVTFGGAAATSVNVINSTTVTAVSPAGAAGAVDVVITTPSGSATLTNGFTYLATAVGQSASGGTIACLNGGLNNLIAATSDNSTGVQWGAVGVDTFAASTTDGAGNTSTIIAAIGAGTNYAAGICDSYEIDSQGNTPCEAGNTCYNDWFLPAGNNLGASGQLNCLFTNRVAIGGFANDFYWSSTEVSMFIAWLQSIDLGFQINDTKVSSFRVRCVRAFTP